MIDTVIRDLNFVIKINPKNAAALNALGYTLADRTDRLDEALKLMGSLSELLVSGKPFSKGENPRDFCLG